MATIDEVMDTLTLLVDANLSFPPKNIGSTAKVWVRLLEDVPAAALEQAALDHITTNGEFPRLAKIREAARDVMSHNGKSAAPNPFVDTDSRPRRVPMVRFSPKAESLIASLEEKYYDAGLPTDEELAEVDRLCTL